MLSLIQWTKGPASNWCALAGVPEAAALLRELRNPAAAQKAANLVEWRVSTVEQAHDARPGEGYPRIWELRNPLTSIAISALIRSGWSIAWRDTPFVKSHLAACNSAYILALHAAKDATTLDEAKELASAALLKLYPANS